MLEGADRTHQEGFVLVLSLLDHFGGVWIELLDSHAGKKEKRERSSAHVLESVFVKKNFGLGLRKADCAESINRLLASVLHTMTDQYAACQANFARGRAATAKTLGHVMPVAARRQRREISGAPHH